MKRRDFFCLLGGIALSGCADKVKEKPDAMSLLSKPRSSENSIAVEFAMVQVLPYRHRLLHEMWNQVDQQILELDVRKRLTQNGMRVGVTGQALPPALRSLMNPAAVAEDEMTDVQREMHQAGWLEADTVVHGHTRLTVLPGQSRDMVITPPRAVLNWQFHGPTGTTQHRLEQAISKVRLTMSPASGDAVSLGVLPLISHGASQPQYTADGNKFVFEIAQNEHLLGDMQVKIDMRPGETLVIGPSLDRNGDAAVARLGDVLFHHDQASPSDTLVLLRLLGARTSDLFDPRLNRKPLVSVAS